MTRLSRIAAISLLLFTSLACFAQITYKINPSQVCGQVIDQPFSCTIGLSPANALGIYPTMNPTNNLVTNTGGYLAWSTTQGPTGQYLGGGVIDSSSSSWAQVCSNGTCIKEVTQLDITFNGVLCPCSNGGSGTYTGSATVYMTYYRQYFRYRGWQWVRTITGGSVTIH